MRAGRKGIKTERMRKRERERKREKERERESESEKGKKERERGREKERQRYIECVCAGGGGGEQMKISSALNRSCKIYCFKLCMTCRFRETIDNIIASNSPPVILI